MELNTELNGLIQLTESDIKTLMRSLREVGSANYNWDINILEGEWAENKLKELMLDKDGTVEVKRDFQCGRTGNIAVEVSYRGEPSGLAATKAEWWAYCLGGPEFDDEVFILIKTARLRQIVEAHNSYIIGRYPQYVKMALIPVKTLLNP